MVNILLNNSGTRKKGKPISSDVRNPISPANLLLSSWIYYLVFVQDVHTINSLILKLHLQSCPE